MKDRKRAEDEERRERDVFVCVCVRVNVRFLGNWFVLCLTVSSSFLFLLVFTYLFNSLLI